MDITSGEIINPLGALQINSLFNNGIAFVSFAGVVGSNHALIDIATGEEILPRGSHWVYGAYNGMIAIRRFSDNRSAIIDLESGDEVIPWGRYDSIINFSNGMAIVQLMGETAIVRINR